MYIEWIEFKVGGFNGDESICRALVELDLRVRLHLL